MIGKICVVTGASSGIGQVTALELARMGATVVMMGRNRQRAEEARADIIAQSGNSQVELILADFSSLAAVRGAAAELLGRHGRIDVLVNNAGGFVEGRRRSADGYELTFAVNHLAPFLLTSLLLDALRAGAPSRVVTVSSGAHMAGRGGYDPRVGSPYDGFQAYAESKLANVLFTYELARRLEGSGVSANCLHPGAVRTNFGADSGGLFGLFFGLAKPFMRSPEQGAQTSIYLASAREVEGVSGKYFANRRAQPSSPVSYDRALQSRLWALSEDLVEAAAPVAV